MVRMANFFSFYSLSFNKNCFSIDSVVELSHSECSTRRKYQNRQHSKKSEFLFLKNPVDPLSMNSISEDSKDEIVKTEEVIKVEVTDNSIAQTIEDEEDRSKPIVESTTKPNITSKSKPNITSKFPVQVQIPQIIPHHYFPLYPHYIIPRHPYHHFPHHLPVKVMFHCYPFC